jgi:hypothetical protein
MKVKELIEQLKEYNPNDEVVFMDNEYWFMKIDVVYTDRKEKIIDWEVRFKERVVLDYNAK